MVGASAGPCRKARVTSHIASLIGTKRWFHVGGGVPPEGSQNELCPVCSLAARRWHLQHSPSNTVRRRQQRRGHVEKGPRNTAERVKIDQQHLATLRACDIDWLPWQHPVITHEHGIGVPVCALLMAARACSSHRPCGGQGDCGSEMVLWPPAFGGVCLRGHKLKAAAATECSACRSRCQQ